MPERLKIHSSLVSMTRAKAAFETASPGRYRPDPRIVIPGIFSVFRGFRAA
jgi:hypothetical protein